MLVRSLLLSVALLLTSSLWADPRPSDYPTTVHVYSTHWREWTSPALGSSLTIEAAIAGHRYELESWDKHSYKRQLLTLGDYPGKLVQDVHKTSYEFTQTWRLLMPDGSTWDFEVIGQTE